MNIRRVLFSLYVLIFWGNVEASNDASARIRDEYIKSAGEYLGKCMVASEFSKYCTKMPKASLDECASRSVFDLSNIQLKREIIEGLKQAAPSYFPQIQKNVEATYEAGLRSANGNIELFCANIQSRILASTNETQEKLKGLVRNFSQLDNSSGRPILIRTQISSHLSIEVPSNWTVLNSLTQEAIQSNVDVVTQNQAVGDLKYAANFYDEQNKTIALVNIRFYPQNRMTQTDARNLNPQTLKIIDEEARKVEENFSRQFNRKVVQPQTSSIVLIDGVFIIRQESLIENLLSRQKIREIKYRVWNAPSSFTLVLSVVQSQEKDLLPIIEQIGRSIRINR